MELALTNIINVSVSQSPVGLGDFNINNIGLFTSDQFLSNDDGDLYRAYVSPQDVGTDFGTDTETYRLAVGVFSQQPNILQGNGQLIIFPAFTASSISTVSVTAGGTGYKVGDILTAVQTDGALGYLTVSAVSSGVVTALVVTSGGIGYTAAAGVTTTGGSGSGCIVTITAVTTETLLQALVRCAPLVYFNGILSNTYPAAGSMKALADAVQAYHNKTLFLPSSDSTVIGGAFTDIKNATDNNTRCLYYSTSAAEARLFAARYAGRGMSVNFEGSATALTMNLKQLVGMIPDPSMTQSLKDACQTAGVDIYTSIAGFSCALSFGANKYFDEVYNLIWFVSKLEVSGFNALALTSTKLPQTDAGVSVLVGAYRQVCQEAVNNGYLAPGAWTSPNTFGDQAAFLQNIVERGYYLYNTPVAQQSAADRAARKAPLIQIAIKEAGAIQSSDVIVNINP